MNTRLKAGLLVGTALCSDVGGKILTMRPRHLTEEPLETELSGDVTIPWPKNSHIIDVEPYIVYYDYN